MAYEPASATLVDGEFDGSGSVEAAPESSSASPSLTPFALQLSESAQRKARESGDALCVIAAILDRALKGSGAGIYVETLFSAEQLDGLSGLVARAVCLDSDYKPVDFAAWYLVRVPTDRADSGSAAGQSEHQCRRQCNVVDELLRRLSGPGFPDVKAAHALRRLGGPGFPDVEAAHALRLNATGRLFNQASTGPVKASDLQPYLGSKKHGGIEARCVWKKSYTGQGIRFADVEQGWYLTHSNLPPLSQPPNPEENLPPPPTTTSTNQITPQSHCCEALGVVLGTGLGVAPSATVAAPRGVATCNPGDAQVFSETYPSGQLSMSAIATATGIQTDSPPGTARLVDVLLVECQGSVGGSQWVPVEIYPSSFQVINAATSAGVVVVEPAGDGGQWLDGLVIDSTTQMTFDTTAAGFQDSGAIIVGAADAQTPDATDPTIQSGKFPPLGGSNANSGTCTGSRVNLFAWGNSVYTSMPPNTYGDSQLNLTSSASAIVAGAAMIVQDMAIAITKKPLSATAVRTALATNGTCSADPANDDIGVMPNLREILGSYFNQLAKSDMRDYVGDDVDRRTSTTARSPDIITRQLPVSDPQWRFGSHSARNDDMLSQPVQPWKTNSIYVRLLNGGGEDATDVSVNVYWSLPTTVPTPGTWNAIGTTTLPCVPTQNVLTVSDAIDWLAADVPEDGNVCLVAVAGSEHSPAPVFDVPPPGCSAADVNEAFLKQLEKGASIAMRNVNLVPPTPDGRHALRFSVPCDWSRGEEHALESVGGLPRGALIRLRLPRLLVQQLHVKLTEGCWHHEHSEIALLPTSRFQIGKGQLQASEAAQCELLVQLPEGMLEQPGIFEFAVRHLCGDREIGRVTWRFVHSEHDREAVFLPQVFSGL
jgi:hypothetical protein